MPKGHIASRPWRLMPKAVPTIRQASQQNHLKGAGERGYQRRLGHRHE
ncbi:MAG: hypothetical protein HY747_01555 [Elusimicrobia bacterium]|nr:hypothetical protein [Elusimicrobiota bacterium]